MDAAQLSHPLNSSPGYEVPAADTLDFQSAAGGFCAQGCRLDPSAENLPACFIQRQGFVGIIHFPYPF
jgi:hypothetical protein